MKERDSIDTRMIHAGEPRPTVEGAVLQPIFQSATYEHFGDEKGKPVRYARLNNTPNHDCLHAKIASLEGTETSLVAASGMAAISAACLALIPEGGHLIAQDNLYGGTHQFFLEDFPSMGRKISFFSTDCSEDIKKLVRPETKGIFVESISNPLMKVPDLPAIASFAKEKGLLSFIDNTFPSPFNFNPSALGYDVILHSATKYLNGHTDIVAGAVAGSRAIVGRVARLLKHLGGSLDPHACFLLNRGIKTLGVRMRWHNDSALRIATALEKNSRVKRVLYPGLRSHPDFARAKELFRGFGGMLSFEFDGDPAQTDRFLRRLTLPYVAPSLGGVESLVTRPVVTSHSWLSAEEREKSGIRDNLVRFSVGLEDPQDLIWDLEQALIGN